MAILYLIPTPIGNLKDITLRAIDVLYSVDLIACEDTRRTGLLLQGLHPLVRAGFPRPNHNGQDNGEDHGQGDLAPTKHVLHPPLLSFNDHNESQRIPHLIGILKSGKSIALVSDAGTPLISDPGFKLIREAIKENVRVESLPGPSSIITALPLTGFPINEFVFLGYPPSKGNKRSKFFEQLKHFVTQDQLTVVIFEAPHRLLETLTRIQQTTGELQVVTARELTKVHEEIRRELLSSAINYYSENKPRGEFTIILRKS